jgi:hypothetical protein
MSGIKCWEIGGQHIYWIPGEDLARFLIGILPPQFQQSPEISLFSTEMTFSKAPPFCEIMGSGLTIDRAVRNVCEM